MDEKTKQLRKYGYDIVINNFEPLLREYLVNEVIKYNYGLKGWKKYIPAGVIDSIRDEKEKNIKKFLGDYILYNVNEFYNESNGFIKENLKLK
jgi:hypothetical protein